MSDSPPHRAQPPATASRLSRFVRGVFRWTVRCFLWGTVLALIVLLFAIQKARPIALGWWSEAITAVDVHLRFETAHPGWSFPARVHTTAAHLDLPPEKLMMEAEARGYVENCRNTGPGEFCRKAHEVVPRSGDDLEPIELGWLIGPDSELRMWLPLKDAPKVLIDAIMAAEDRDYYRHHGVNFTAMTRAVLANAQEGTYVQGASTLTMQVVRNLVQRKEKTVERKLREMVMAMAIEHHLGKDRVLEMYLNTPYLGQWGGLSICGFSMAARHYYGKAVQDLTLAEAATLAGILPAPGRFGPDHAPAIAKERRDRVLHTLAESYGYDVTEALAEPVTVVSPSPLPDRFPAYLSTTRAWLEGQLPPQVVYGAGLDVTVAMDVFSQETTWRLFVDKVPHLQRMAGRRIDAPLQSAAVLLDTATGAIKAVYGGNDVTAVSFNRATQAKRQAGSAFKPLVYALAMSQPSGPDGQPRFTAASVVPNTPRVFKTPQGDWNPRNIGGEYTPTSCLAQGIAWSQNIATASLLEEIGGPDPLIDFAKRLGFDVTAFPSEMGLSLGQGEVTPLEMARFAAIVANGGHWLEGSPVLRAVDPGGMERIRPPAAGAEVLTPEVAALTRELMRLVVDVGTGGAARGRGGEAGYAGQVMGKTGTTDREKDLWFVGASPTLAAALWLGYDVPEKLGASASDFAAPLWGWWMNRLTKYDGELPTFSSEPKLVRRDICTLSGKHPNESCRRITASFLPGTAPHGTCDEIHPPPVDEVDSEDLLYGLEGLIFDPTADLTAAPQTSPRFAIPNPFQMSRVGDASTGPGSTLPGTAGSASLGSGVTVPTMEGTAGTTPAAPGQPRKPRVYRSIWERQAEATQAREREKGETEKREREKAAGASPIGSQSPTTPQPTN